jgi:uncharacterized protein YqhQ
VAVGQSLGGLRAFCEQITMNGTIRIGGQAVIEGVMMRAPHALVIAVRRPDGDIVYREDRWNSLAQRWSPLRWPFVRGSVALIEAMVNGIQALSFSASQAFEEDEEELSPWALALTIGTALALAICLFVVLPHLLTLWLGRLGPWMFAIDNPSFHMLDGFVKVVFFVLYIWIISLSGNIRRVFEYHGAEHKSIFAYEAGEVLTVANAQKYSTLHPRCGTAFILMVLISSILLFSLIFPWMPSFTSLPVALRTGIIIVEKILLLIPIAGLSYEWIRFSSKHKDNSFVRCSIKPGIWLQRLTTREPSDAQVEIALRALERALVLEKRGEPQEAA